MQSAHPDLGLSLVHNNLVPTLENRLATLRRFDWAAPADLIIVCLESLLSAAFLVSKIWLTPVTVFTRKVSGEIRCESRTT